MKDLLKTVKGKLIVGGCIVAVAAVAIVAVVFLSREESFRSMAVDRLQGTTLITNETAGEKEAYKGMHLYSGDDVKVQKESNLTLRLDADKYMYAQENTHFKVESTENETDNKLVIHLSEGGTLNRLENSLKDGESYTVETPNATMAVRGTVFRVTVDRDEEGLIYTLVEVFDGKVQVDLKCENGDYNGVFDTFGPGESALIRGNTEFAEFVVGEEGSYKQEIAYKQIPRDVAKVLVEYIEDGEELCIGKELLMDYTGLAEHKMETITGQEATCTEDGYKEVWCVVCNEVTETIKVPATGHTMADWEIAKDPTCLLAGNRQRICKVCNDYYEDEEIVALGHEKGEYKVTKEADCTHAGTQTAMCTRCGAVADEKEIAALGHKAGSMVTVRTATCTATGLSQAKCTVCGEVAQSSTTAALGHTLGTPEITDPDCVNNGSRKATCTVCGTVETTVIPALGHSFSGWDTLEAATCEGEGIEARYCNECQASEERTIAPTGHSTIAGGHYDAVFSNDTGLMLTIQCSEYCENCDYSASVEAEVVYKGDVPYCQNCGMDIAY